MIYKNFIDDYLKIENFIVFFIGLVLGGLLFLFFLKIDTLITNKRQNKNNKRNKIKVSEKDKTLFLNEEQNNLLEIKELPHQLIKMLQKIASLYYENAEYPCLQLSIEETIFAIKYLANKIEDDSKNNIFFNTLFNLKISSIEDVLKSDTIKKIIQLVPKKKTTTIKTKQSIIVKPFAKLIPYFGNCFFEIYSKNIYTNSIKKLEVKKHE